MKGIFLKQSFLRALFLSSSLLSLVACGTKTDFQQAQPLAFSYPAIDVRTPKLTEMTPVYPISKQVGNQNLFSYSISPDLPEGIHIDTKTGVISGRPLDESERKNYTVTITNSAGKTSTEIFLQVHARPPQAITINPASVVGVVGDLVNIQSQVTTEDRVRVEISPNLSDLAGLQFNSEYGSIQGTLTKVLPETDFTIKASNTGGSVQGVFKLRVDPPLSIAPLNSQIYQGSTQAFSAVGGVPPYVFSIESGPGSINANTGLYTSTLLGTARVVVTDKLNRTSKTNITVVVQPPSNLTYSTNPAVYTKGIAIASNTPSNSGGAITGYTLSPTEPAGLTFNKNTGVLSGTPTALQSSIDYTVTGSNASGSTQVVLKIQINDQAPTNLILTPNPSTQTRGASVSLGPITYSGGAITSYTVVSGALPPGLNVLPTGVISGTIQAAAPLGDYTATVRGSNSGGYADLVVQITVVDVAPANLTYSVNPAVYTKNIAIAPNSPSNTGGAITAYSINPTPPAGLTFNTNNGILSGTPTQLQGLTNYTIKGTNSGGSAQVILKITVNDQPPSNLQINPNPANITRGVYFQSNAPTQSGGVITNYSILAGQLPPGLSIDFSSGIISGTVPSNSPLLIYSATVRGTNSGGSVDLTVGYTVIDVAPTSLTYSTNPAVYTKGVAIATNSPSNTGGIITSYSVSPALPAGLSLDTGTGKITGNPSVIQSSMDYTITGLNSGGSTQVVLKITISDQAPLNLSYSENPANYYLNEAITPNIPSNTGGAITSYTISPTPPTGLSFDTTTGKLTGTPTASQVAIDYTVTGKNTGGTASVILKISVAQTIQISPTTWSMYPLEQKQFSATGGIGSYTYSIVSGPGSINATGLFTANAVGSVIVRVRDTKNHTSDAAVTINSAVPIIQFTPSSLTILTSDNLNTKVTTTIVQGPVTSCVRVSVPASVTVSATCGLSGLLAQGVYAITVRAMNGTTPGADTTVNVQVDPPMPVIGSYNSPLNLMVGDAIGAALAPAIITGPITSCDLSAVLPTLMVPSGISISATTCAITGSISTAGSYNLSAKPGNLKGDGSAQYGLSQSLTINVSPTLQISPTTWSLYPNDTKQFSASGGVGALTYSLVSGPGTMNSTGLYTATAVGTAVVRVTDTKSHTADATITILPTIPVIQFNPNPATILTSDNLSAKVSTTIVKGPVTSCVKVSGPAAVSVSATCGLSGVLPQGVYTITVRPMNGTTAGADTNLNLQVDPPVPAIGAYATPYNTVVSDAIGAALTPSIITGPITSCDLTPVIPTLSVPSGISISPTTCAITGSISIAGTYYLSIKPGNLKGDGTAQYGSTQSLTIVVAPALTIVPSTVTLVITDTYQFSATGGSGGNTYSLVSGVGSVSTAGLYNASAVGVAVVRVRDSKGHTSDANITVAPMPSLTPANSVIQLGTPLTLNASGGRPPYTFNIVSGPGGLTSSVTSTIYTSAQIGVAIVRVTDRSGHTADATVTVIGVQGIDTTFGTNGTTLLSGTSIYPNNYWKPSGWELTNASTGPVVVMGDDRLVYFYNYYADKTAHFQISRLSPNGALELDSKKVLLPLPTPTCDQGKTTNTVQLSHASYSASDNTIVLSYWHNCTNGSAYEMISKIDSSGNVITTFGSSGILAFTSGFLPHSAIAASDGSIYAFGWSGTNLLQVKKFTATGVAAPFAAGPWNPNPSATYDVPSPRNLHVLPNGNIVAVHTVRYDVLNYAEGYTVFNPAGTTVIRTYEFPRSSSNVVDQITGNSLGGFVMLQRQSLPADQTNILSRFDPATAGGPAVQFFSSLSSQLYPWNTFVQPDAKTYFLQDYVLANGNFGGSILQRYNVDGTPDSLFNYYNVPSASQPLGSYNINTLANLLTGSNRFFRVVYQPLAKRVVVFGMKYRKMIDINGDTVSVPTQPMIIGIHGD